MTAEEEHDQSQEESEDRSGSEEESGSGESEDEAEGLQCPQCGYGWEENDTFCRSCMYEPPNFEAKDGEGDDGEGKEGGSQGEACDFQRGPYEYSLASSLTGGNYEGEYVNGRMEGNGKFTFPNGTVYEGEFKDGMFHGTGTMYFPGLGKFKSSWDHGVKIEGNYTFADGLKYQDEWDYCTIDKDRRFYTERLTGTKPAGESQFCNPVPPTCIPKGGYDTGDGYYDSGTHMVLKYDTGEEVRTVEEDEDRWIKERCLYQY